MARDKADLQNIDKSDPSNYLNGRIKDNSGAGNGTPVNERVYGDLHQTFAKLMNLAGLSYNGLPDNESNGYQLVDAIRALATKNDFFYSLNQSGSNLTLPLRLGKLQVDEIFTVKATFDKSTQTSIRGTLDNVSKSVTYLSDFKDGDYLKVINRSSSVLLLAEIDALNLARVASELGFLKAANQTQENAGTSDEVATTPATNKSVFSRRVIGNDSGDYLASASRNGLLSADQWEIINGIGAPALRNRGNFVLGDVRGNPVGTNYVVSGDLASAQKTQDLGDGDVITVTFDNAMDNTNYRLDVFAESTGNMTADNNIDTPVFQKNNASSAKIYIEKNVNTVTSIKIHVDVIQL